MKNYLKQPMLMAKGHVNKLLLFGIIVGSFLPLSARSLSEGSKFNISFKNASIEEVFQEIESQSEYRFLYRLETIGNKLVTIDARNAGIDEVLQEALTNANVEYTILDNNLVVIKPITRTEVMQGVEVSGIITSAADGVALPGVNVVEKGTQNGTVTDLNGKYTLIVSSPSAVIQYSFMGFLPQEVTVNEQTSINISLSEDVLELDQVVFVGYGSMKKSDLTGAVVSVDEEILRSSVSPNLDQVLQGRVAGVQISQNSGQPGGATSIRIRGATSLNFSNEPLYVIDGVQFQGEGTQVAGFDWAGGANGQNRVNPLSTINPNDIVSIEVLKDASASAIYGAKAANGVVLITTRAGQEGKTRISYNNYFTYQTVPKMLEMMDLPQFAEYQMQIRDELGNEQDDHYLDPSILGPGTDWQSEIFRPAWLQSHNFSVSGGTGKSTYLLSLGYFDQDGIIIGSDFGRYNARIKMDNQINKWLTIGGNFYFARTSETITLNDGGDGVIMNALKMAPDIPVMDFDGNYSGPSVTYAGANYNPVALALIRNNKLTRDRYMGNAYAVATIMDGLSLRSEISIDRNSSNNLAFHPTYQFGAIENRLNKMRQRVDGNFFWVWNNVLTYNKKFAQKHEITAMAAFEMQESQWEGIDITKENFSSNDIHVLSQGENPTLSTNGWKDGSSQVSVFGRLNYNYDQRYLATFTLRRDGSSMFGPENKYGTFPSASVAWRLSNESFMQGITPIHDLKLRLGFGMVGNSPTTPYLWGATLQSNNSPFGTFYRAEKHINPGLKWESTAMTNLGLDLALFKGRVSLVAEAYTKITEDMLMQVIIPNYLGGPNNWQDIAAPYVNAGKMENKGFELSLTTHNVQRNKFSWKSELTFSLNRNEITELADTNTQIFDGLYWYSEFQTATLTTVGQPIGVFYGYKVDKIFENAEEILAAPVQIVDPDSVSDENPIGVNLVNQTTGVWIGDIKFTDVNGDGVIDEDDQTIIGDPNPDFTFGFNNTFTIGDFDVSIFLQGSYGAEILNYSRVPIENMMSLWDNQSAAVANRSQYALIDPEGDPEDIFNVELANPGTEMPRFATNDVNRNNRMSERFIEDGSYLRIQNISIAYTLPEQLTQKVNVNRLRVYVKAQNLYTFTKYSGYDPEIGAFNQSARVQNLDMGRYPTPRMFTFGLDLDF